MGREHGREEGGGMGVGVGGRLGRPPPSPPESLATTLPLDLAFALGAQHWEGVERVGWEGVVWGWGTPQTSAQACRMPPPH